ncbi:MAG: thermonuclease family protein [Alphaproteobacteria bacterium]|nr:MAG: thermonuclease family protein [Alphaproteobacteria bacterium]
MSDKRKDSGMSDKKNALYVKDSGMSDKKKALYVKDLGWKFTKVLDGDTFSFELPKNPALTPKLRKLSVRVLGIDTPEKGFRGKCEQEKILGQKATDFAKDLFDFVDAIELLDLKWDKYGGRVNATVIITIKDKKYNYTELLIQNKCAFSYDGGTKQSWCEPKIDLEKCCNFEDLPL